MRSIIHGIISSIRYHKRWKLQGLLQQVLDGMTQIYP
ncbi:unnamed protein product [Paramecium octaurelia]|uniref:Transposase n=1 Tax=Paramecium octaurelia TaxID=43137 RepID=A0A8S1V6F2_PAROT|nr:unnamed protein product [Paramecium octaurelia]